MKLIIRNILIGQNYDRVIKGLVGNDGALSIEINAENGKAIITELQNPNHSCCIGKSIEISRIKVKLDDRTMYKTPMQIYDLIRDGKNVEYISYFEKGKSLRNFEVFHDFCGMFAERTDNLGKQSISPLK